MSIKYSIKFDSDANWKSYYKRNYKSSSNKHLLCFPDHNKEGHRTSGFCGRPVRVFLDSPLDSDLVVIGQFNDSNESDNPININATINKSDFINKPNTKSPFYESEEIVPNKVYDINCKIGGWKYNTKVKRNGKMSYSLFAYVLIPTDNPDIFRCVAKSKSPSFLIVSARRTSDPDIKNSVLNKEYKVDSPTTVIFPVTTTLDKALQLSSDIDFSTNSSATFIQQAREEEEEEKEITEEVKLCIPTSPLSKLPLPSPLPQYDVNEKEYSINDNLSYSFFKLNTSIYQKVIHNSNCKLDENIFLPLYDNDDSDSKPKKISRQNFQFNKHEEISSPLCKKRKSIKSLPDINTVDDVVDNDYTSITKKYPVIFKVVNKIKVNSKREELSFYGNSFDQFLNDENCYLDKYGQKCKLCISSLL